MNQRFQTFAQKTYKVFHTPWRPLPPQGIQRIHALLLGASDSNPAPELGKDASKDPQSPLPTELEAPVFTQDHSPEDNIVDPVPSDIHTLSAACSRAKSPPRSRTVLEDQEYTSEFTDGPSRIVSSRDGLAILLTRSAIMQLSQVIQSSHELQSLEKQVREATKKVQRTKDHLANLKFSVESTRNSDEKIRIRQEIDELEPAYRRQKERRRDLDHELGYLQIEVKHLRTQSLSTFESILNEAGLLHIPESIHDAVPENLPEEENNSYHTESQASASLVPQDSGEYPSGLSKAEIVAILEEVEQTRQTLFRAEEAFDATRDENDNDKRVFRENKNGDTHEFTEIELDLFHFEKGARNTRALITAEQNHKEATSLARRLGLLENEFEQESDFADDPDDGYRESQEVDPMAGPNMEYIAEWGGKIVDSLNPFSLETEKAPNEWVARSVAISDTLSCVDLDLEHRRRIDQWQDQMRLEQEEGKRLIEKFSLKRRDSFPVLESCKRRKTSESVSPALTRTISCSKLSGEAFERERMITYSHKTLLAVFYPNKAIDW